MHCSWLINTAVPCLSSSLGAVAAVASHIPLTLSAEGTPGQTEELALVIRNVNITHCLLTATCPIPACSRCSLGHGASSRALPILSLPHTSFQWFLNEQAHKTQIKPKVALVLQGLRLVRVGAGCALEKGSKSVCRESAVGRPLPLRSSLMPVTCGWYQQSDSFSAMAN